MKIGILGASEIAFRRFLPALTKCPELEYAGVASRTEGKAEKFVLAFGGRAYASYDELIEDESIGAVYVPLPPALHHEWGKKALLAGKHLFMEKPFTTNLTDTQALLDLAVERGLAAHENYMFLYHSQLARIREMISDGTLGEIRLYRMAFGFPKRAEGDFRYKRALGGGALLDCGGYPARLALELLGETARVVQARLVQPEGYEVDLYGSAVLENDIGQVAQLAFGMDNSYKCELEVWGSKAALLASRVFTAPDGFAPQLQITGAQGTQRLTLPPDDSFEGSIKRFIDIVKNPASQQESYMMIKEQCVRQQDIFYQGRKA